MSDQIYREQLLDHYKNPRNEGDLNDYTHTAELKNLSCGDEITIKTRLNNNIIEDIKFSGEGCAICIASASMLTEITKKESVEYVNNLKFEDIQEMLGIQLSPSRIKCAHLGLLTLQKALSN